VHHCVVIVNIVMKNLARVNLFVRVIAKPAPTRKVLGGARILVLILLRNAIVVLVVNVLIFVKLTMFV